MEISKLALEKERRFLRNLIPHRCAANTRVKNRSLKKKGQTDLTDERVRMIEGMFTNVFVRRIGIGQWRVNFAADIFMWTYCVCNRS